MAEGNIVVTVRVKTTISLWDAIKFRVAGKHLKPLTELERLDETIIKNTEDVVNE